MGNFFNPDSGVMRALGKLADLLILNVLTVILCLPVFTAGAAFTAMHYVLYQMVKDEESYVAKTFFREFKANFKKATLEWLIALAIAAVLAGDFYLMRHYPAYFPAFLTVIFYLLAFIVLAVFLYVFPLTAKFENTIRGTFHNALLIVPGFFPRTLGIAAAHIVTFFCFYRFRQILPLAFVYCFTAPGFISAFLYRPIFEKIAAHSASKKAAETSATDACPVSQKAAETSATDACSAFQKTAEASATDTRSASPDVFDASDENSDKKSAT